MDFKPALLENIKSTHYTKKQVCNLFGISLSSLRGWGDINKPDTRRNFRGRVYFSKEKVEALYKIEASKFGMLYE